MSTGATLAPPSGKAAPAKLRRAQPQPAGLRPKKGHPFPVWNLYKVPLRVLRPPKATGMVGSVKSFKSTPLTDVRLADVIANKHLSPLSLKDFEGYLVFREYSAESLYFILWLNEYEKEHASWMADTSVEHPAPVANPNTDPTAYRATPHLPDWLSDSLRRGLDVFFTPDGPLELNLPHTVRDKTLVDAGNSGNPTDFAEARDIIEHSLNRSLASHAKACTANAGPRRLVFCFCLGLSVFLLGLVPPFVAIFGGYARGIRAAGLFFIWFGTAVMAMAIQRICGVIWLLGEDRQLLPWELASPVITSGTIVPMNCPSTPSAASQWDEESSYGDDKSPASSYRTQNSANPYPWEKQDAAFNETEGSIVVDIPSQSSRPPSYVSKKSDTRSLVPVSAPVWGSCTSVFSPDVARYQWRAAIFAFLWGAGALCTVGVALMAVPNA